jgi:iron(III) transport system permease protein
MRWIHIMTAISFVRRTTASATPGQLALGGAILLFLILFLILPVTTVIYVAFTERGTGVFTLLNFRDFFANDLFLRSFWNSIWVATMTVVGASLIALPLAYITTRFEFRGSALIQTLGFLPLVMPPFVGAVAMTLLFGRNGSINLLLDEYFDFKIPFMEGLWGVVFVEALHYFPFILVNLSTSLRNIDRSMEEAAQNLSCSGFRLFRRIVLPLAMPGYIAGVSLVFVKVFDDLATPLLLNVKDMMAPQAYLRITSIGIADPMGYVISVMLVIASVLAVWLSIRSLGAKDYATVQRGGGGLAKRRLKPMESLFAYGAIILILLLVLSPHIGLTLLSFATVWSFSPLPDGFTFAHYARVFSDSSTFISNTLLYAALAALIDVVIGGAIAYLVLRSKLNGRHMLDWLATAALAIPGVVIGIGYLRSFYDISLPNGKPLATFWVMIVLALAIRRLPYALRACYAALQQISVSLEEAAENLGATKARTVKRILIPLMTGGMLAGFVTSFSTAAVELSATLMLVQSNDDAPLAYGIYIFMQSTAGRGAGAALGVIAVIFVGLCTYVSQRIVDQNQTSKGMVP